MATAPSVSARALSELEDRLVAGMAAHRFERALYHALMDGLVIEEELARSHQRALGRLTCASRHLSEGILVVAGVLGAEYRELFAELRTQAEQIEKLLADVPIEVAGLEVGLDGPPEPPPTP